MLPGKITGAKKPKAIWNVHICKCLQLNIRGKGFKVLTKKPISNEPQGTREVDDRAPSLKRKTTAVFTQCEL